MPPQEPNQQAGERGYAPYQSPQPNASSQPAQPQYAAPVPPPYQPQPNNQPPYRTDYGSASQPEPAQAPAQTQYQQPYQNQYQGQYAQQPGNPYQQPQPMYYNRPAEPQRQQISPETMQKAEESRKKYPKLNLSEGEYVIKEIKRHPIGLYGIWGGAGFVTLVLLVMLAALASTQGSSELTSSIPLTAVGAGALLIIILVMLGSYVAAWVYRNNTFILTNESIIQNIQTSLFSNRQQTASLGNVEDVSYTQNGIVQHIFGYGSIRLSTQGDETTYRFHQANRPRDNVAILNNAVEAYKNGRPAEHGL